MLTLSGTGFGSGVEVLIESQPCEITSFNYTDLVCTTSAMVSNVVDIITLCLLTTEYQSSDI